MENLKKNIKLIILVALLSFGVVGYYTYYTTYRIDTSQQNSIQFPDKVPMW